GAAQRRAARRASCDARRRRAMHGGDVAVHAGRRRQALPGDAVPDDGRVSGAVARNRLSADSDRRPADAAVHRREDLDRRAGRDLVHVPRPGRGAGIAMDILVLLGAFTLLCALGVPVAYALGLGAIIGALWADIPLEAVMLKISDGTDDFALLAIPFFVLAGAPL